MKMILKKLHCYSSSSRNEITWTDLPVYSHLINTVIPVLFGYSDAVALIRMLQNYVMSTQQCISFSVSFQGVECFLILSQTLGKDNSDILFVIPCAQEVCQLAVIIF
jgi:hypothetical protein